MTARALAKDPQRRWPNCRAFVEALAVAVAGPQRPTRGLLVPLLAPAQAIAENTVVPAPLSAAPATEPPQTFRAGFRMAWGVGLLLAGVGLAFLLFQLFFK